MIVIRFFLIVFVAIMLLLYLCDKISDWKKFVRNEDIRVKWKTFLSMYRISPQKFSYQHDKMYDQYSLTYDISYGRRYHIGLSFPAFLVFSRWIPRQERLKRQEEKRETSEKILKEWQKDIDTYKNNAQKEINEMIQRNQKSC